MLRFTFTSDICTITRPSSEILATTIGVRNTLIEVYIQLALSQCRACRQLFCLAMTTMRAAVYTAFSGSIEIQEAWLIGVETLLKYVETCWNVLKWNVLKLQDVPSVCRFLASFFHCRQVPKAAAPPGGLLLRVKASHHKIQWNTMKCRQWNTPMWSMWMWPRDTQEYSEWQRFCLFLSSCWTFLSKACGVCRSDYHGWKGLDSDIVT